MIGITYACVEARRRAARRSRSIFALRLFLSILSMLTARIKGKKKGREVQIRERRRKKGRKEEMKRGVGQKKKKEGRKERKSDQTPEDFT